MCFVTQDWSRIEGEPGALGGFADEHTFVSEASTATAASDYGGTR